jgi:chromosome segregation ATPase
MKTADAPLTEADLTEADLAELERRAQQDGLSPATSSRLLREVQRLREELDSAIDRGFGYRHERGVAEYTIDNLQRERAALLARAEAAEARVAELERERDEAFSELEAIAHEDGDCECLVFDGEVDLCPHAKRMAEVKP